MNHNGRSHNFVSSALDRSICALCKRPSDDHSRIATCESCGNTCGENGYLTKNDILLCETCNDVENKVSANKSEQEIIKRALEYQAERANNPELVENEIKEHHERWAINSVDAMRQKTLEMAKQIDASITTRGDLFNANTVSIVELKAAIDADDSIKNKHFKLAEVITERFNHLTQVIFEHKAVVVAAGNEQKSIHQYLNTLASKLTQEERAKIKLKDINYKPEAPKEIKKKITTKRLDKDEVRKWAREVNVPEQVIQMICLQKGIDPEIAARQFRRTEKEINQTKKLSQ